MKCRERCTEVKAGVPGSMQDTCKAKILSTRFINAVGGAPCADPQCTELRSKESSEVGRCSEVQLATGSSPVVLQHGRTQREPSLKHRSFPGSAGA